MKKTRDSRYDLIRVLAMGLVIVTHALGTIPIKNNFNDLMIHEIITTFIFICNPLFFMMSGHFNLHFSGKTVDSYKNYYFKKLVTIVIPLVLYEIIFYAFTYIISKEPLNFSLFVKGLALSMFQNYSDSYFWFMYTLIAFLLAAPFLSRMLDHFSVTDQIFFMRILFGVQIISWIFSVMGIHFALNSYPFAGWLIYFLLGRLLEQVPNISRLKSTIIVLVTVSFNILATITFPESKSWGLHDLSTPYILFSMVIYLTILNTSWVKRIGTSSLIKFLAHHSFGVYLIHGNFLLIANKFIRINNSFLEVFLLVVVTYLLSIIGSSIIQKLILSPIKNSLLKLSI